MPAETKNSTRVVIPGDMAGNAAAAFSAALSNLLASKPGKVRLDCSGIRYITPDHIYLLWDAYQICTAAGAKVQLVSLSPGLESALRALNLGELFPRGAQLSASGSIPLRFPVRSETVTSYIDEFGIDDAGFEAGQRRFLRFLARLDLTEVTEFELRTVFYEVATNIRTHAGLGEDGTIEFTARADSNGIVLEFKDSGVEFDWNCKDPDVDFKDAARRRQRRGFGITVIRRLADNISCVRTGDARNVLRIEKEWGI